jgi:8-oxo-dGTP pyrophosphatase MutT (NUDIX family)
MLLFACVSPARLDAVAREGLRPAPPEEGGGEGVRLWLTLAAAQAAAARRAEATGTDPTGSAPAVLVLDGPALAARARSVRPDALVVPSVPPEAVCNADPYRPPRLVEAGGGYVIRPLDPPSDEGASNHASDDASEGEAGDLAVLLIHRKGRWDVPKGKRDAEDATVEACAAREVQEEVGIDALTVLHPVGATHHGYPHGDAYVVKETHWFLMQTPARTFTPERREGIRRVAWARWTTARRHVGYDTLRRHMRAIEPQARRIAAALRRG